MPRVPRAVAVLTATVTATLGLGIASPSLAGPSPESVAPGHGSGAARGYYDARTAATRSATAHRSLTSARATKRPALRKLAAAGNKQLVIDIDPATGTPRWVGKLNGFLTAPSTRPARRVVIRYVSEHQAAFGLTNADLRTFSLHRVYRDIRGTRHLFFTQIIDHKTVFGAGLIAAVSRHGRLLTLAGSPVSTSSLSARDTTVSGSPAAAITAAKARQGDADTSATSSDRAVPVLFVANGHVTPAWSAVTMSSTRPALTVLASGSDRVLFHRPLGSDASAEPTGLAYGFYPGAPRGGTAQPVDFGKLGWLSGSAATLSGNNSHTYSDVNDDNKPQGKEEVHPRVGHQWDYDLQRFVLPRISFCSKSNPMPCSWDPNKAYSWKVNRAQNAVQVFTYVNRMHDHLLSAPIGFTEAAGNFQRRNFTTAGRGRDAVDTQTDDGANTDHGLPDGNHIDNANMDTPPDGTPPIMQMYLQHQPGSSYPDGDPFAPTNVGDEADTVYHEYTHGLSNRLVVDAQGNSTLGGVQAGAMGEAWSDWYAADFLNNQGLLRDPKNKVNIVMFRYDGAGAAYDRTEPLDCKVGSTSGKCNGGYTGHGGGYTYADYGQVIGSPEVHADGEIWAQSIWDLRDKLGAVKAETLVTRSMELAPMNPSFLDIRNAILVADQARYGGKDQPAIWAVFAHRGMGFYAGSLGGDDAAPAADGHVPPAAMQTGEITGHVVDLDSHKPVAGVPVTLAFQGAGMANPTAITDSNGFYRLGPVPQGHYGKIGVMGAGYVPVTGAVNVGPGVAVRDFAVRRDWAAASGGASVVDFTGPDYSAFGCGPGEAIDLSQVTGWSSTTGDDNGTPTNHFIPKSITVDLGQPVDVSTFAVDPSATCGDGGSASTGAYKIETSPDGVAWTQAASGAFGIDQRGQLNQVAPTAGAASVRYVRFTILGNQTPDFATNCPGGAYSGCSYSDLSELEVYGVPTP